MWARGLSGGGQMCGHMDGAVTDRIEPWPASGPGRRLAVSHAIIQQTGVVFVASCSCCRRHSATLWRHRDARSSLSSCRISLAAAAAAATSPTMTWPAVRHAGVMKTAIQLVVGYFRTGNESVPKITINDAIILFSKLQSTFWLFQTITVSECCSIKLLPYISFETLMLLLPVF